MTLTTYAHKRNFKNTPEPKSGSKTLVGANRRQLKFVIQEHHASHLHYDLRLECQGVLKSWAIPKVPVMDHSIKRLAVQVEDHPLAYGSFEGMIPEGNYGAGSVSIWDKGSYSVPGIKGRSETEKGVVAGLNKGELKFILHGQRLSGGFALVELKDKKNWLLIKHNDELNPAPSQDQQPYQPSAIDPALLSGAKQARLPATISPMLATLIEKPFDDKNWLFEIKWDGYRAIASIRDGKAKLDSRNGLSFTENYPQVVAELQQLGADMVLDGELVALDSHGRSSFHLLQNYLQTGKGRIAYYIFDVLYYAGHDLQPLPLLRRKQLLQNIIPAKLSYLKLSEHVTGEGKKLFAAASDNEVEGIVAKKSDSTYEAGKRSKQWLKIKIIKHQEAVIGGYKEETRSGDLGSLLVGVYQPKGLQFIGGVGSGFDAEERSRLLAQLQQLEQSASPFSPEFATDGLVHWIKPQLVCEIKFSDWTPDGYMRHPVYQGLRQDKRVEDIHQELPSARQVIASQQTIQKEYSHHRVVTFTNSDKVFWPEEGFRKQDVIAYYEQIGPVLLTYLKDRPENLNRHPNGIAGESFFQKDVEFETPDWVEKITLYSESAQKEIQYLLCQNLETLLYMVNLGCIEINPWNSRIKRLDFPDYLLFDLDPEQTDFTQVIKVARELHGLFAELKLEHFCKTSGGRGLHVYLPLAAKYDYEQVRHAVELIAALIQERLPDIVSLERSPQARQGRVYIDYLQNRRGQTTVAPYSLRPRPGAHASAPLHWDELTTDLDPGKFTIQTMAKRLKTEGDLWQGVLGKGIDLSAILAQLENQRQA